MMILAELVREGTTSYSDCVLKWNTKAKKEKDCWVRCARKNEKEERKRYGERS